MRVTATVAAMIALLLTTAAQAEQVGGPSGPQKGQLSLGGEAILRTNVDMRGEVPGVLVYDWSLRSTALYGVLEYGVTDALSVRGKAGVAEWESLAWPPQFRQKYDYGFAWAAGLKWRICRPEDHGTALALSGQYAESEGDASHFPPILPPEYHKLETKEWTAALTVGVPHGSARPYAGVVYSDLDLDYRFSVHNMGGGLILIALPHTAHKRHHVGAVLGIDHDLGSAGYWNLEARAFDEEGISGSLNFTF